MINVESGDSAHQLELSWADLSLVMSWELCWDHYLSRGGLVGPMINVLIVGEEEVEDIIPAGYPHFLVITPPLNTSHLLLIY